MGPDSGRDRQQLAPGHRLDGYELLWPVGEGGMATVWVARLMRKHGFEKLVAIKTILPKFAEDETFQKMFLDEARIASRIDHTNVAHIHDLGEQDGVLYIVMEYVDGDALTRLRKVLFKKAINFPVPIALRIMADVCAGLHAAHEMKGLDGTPLGVVHRDVSPQNVLISAEGVSKLIDFGVAKAEQRLTEETHTGFVKGKVQYMAPEQALGKNVDRRADVWAVGAVIYHLIANKPPFEADNQLALLALLQRGRPPAPLPATIPSVVSELVRKALTHNMQLRFQTAMEMKNAIEKTGLAASQEEVGAFMREHLADFAERRKRALAQALQQVDGIQSSRQLSSPDLTSQSMKASTQRISSENLPRLGPPAPVQATPPMPPPSDPRIGPPTPQSFAIGATSAPRLAAHDPRRMTVPLGAVPAGVLPPNLTPPPPPVLQQPTSPSLTPNPRQGAVPSYGSSMQTQTQPQAPVPPGFTEPLPSPDAIEAAAEAKENTNGGSLGLASISTSVPTKRPGNASWLVIGAVAALSVAAAVGIGLGVRGSLASKKFDPQFAPLPSAATALPPASVAQTAPTTPPPDPTPTPTPTPTPVSVPAPSDTTSAAEPTTPSATAGAHTGAPTVPHPPVTATPPFGVRPAPTGSGKKRPKVDDGF